MLILIRSRHPNTKTFGKYSTGQWLPTGFCVVVLIPNNYILHKHFIYIYISIIFIVVGIGLALFTNKLLQNHRLSFVYPWTYIADGQRLRDNYRRTGETKYKRYYFCGGKKLSLYETKYVFVFKPHFNVGISTTFDDLNLFLYYYNNYWFSSRKIVYKMYNIIFFNGFTYPSIVIIIMQVKSI